MGLVAVDGMLPLPARATEIFEALEVTAEVRSNYAVAHGAQRIFQVGVNLDLQLREREGWMRACGHWYNAERGKLSSWSSSERKKGQRKGRQYRGVSKSRVMEGGGGGKEECRWPHPF